jgi:hypothetical protein
MNKNKNDENASQVSATQTIDSAESLYHHDIRNKDDDQYEIPPPLIAWLARINQRYFSDTKHEELIE